MSRRWLLVAAGAAALVGAVPLRDALPVAPRSDPSVPLLASAMQELVLQAPDPTALVPPRPPGSSRVQVDAADFGGALRVLDAPDPPAEFAGRRRVAPTVGGATGRDHRERCEPSTGTAFAPAVAIMEGAM